MTVGLVACCKSKLNYPAAARDLYTSTWFRAARTYIERCCSEWYILSSKHGLLEPTQVVLPYEETLLTMTTVQRHAWNVRVIEQLKAKDLHHAHLIVLAGQLYRQPMVAMDCTYPLDLLPGHRGLGWQIHYLQKWNRIV